MSTADRNIALNGVSRAKRIEKVIRELTIELEERVRFCHLINSRTY
jgi:hypothetical protein